MDSESKTETPVMKEALPNSSDTLESDSNSLIAATTLTADVDETSEKLAAADLQSPYKPAFKNFALHQGGELFPIFPDKLLQNEVFKKPISFQRPVSSEKCELESNPFVEAAIKQSQRSLTENSAVCFSTSGDPRLDFYFQMMEQSNSDTAVNLLKDSWAKNDLHTLKLVANLRDIRGGKGIRRQYQDCLYWMYENHPETLYKNLPQLLQFGYWKDSLHMLTVILFDGFLHPFFNSKAISEEKDKNGLVPKKIRRIADTEKRTYNEIIAKHYGWKIKVSEIPRKNMREMRLKFAREKFTKDIKYRAFHVRVAQLFAEQLIKDKAELKDASKQKKTVSLAGKWAPSLEAHFDRYLLIGTTISLELLKALKTPEYDEILQKPIPIASYLARKLYNKEFCIPIRKFHEIPETYMSSNQWTELKYQRVAAKCMQKNKSLFISHDKERFETYLSSKTTKVAGASLKPIEIISRAMQIDKNKSEDNELERLVIEKQWTSLVEDIKKKGGGMLQNAISICDVSGSMEGQPLQAAMGLTLLAMKMTQPPWNSVCISFHHNPTLLNFPSEMSLMEQVESLRKMPWGSNTDLHKVFECILSLGTKNKLKNTEMPKLLLIFSDMEFDEACPDINETNYEAAKKMFEEKGYTLPSIVFWNLRSKQDRKTSPVQLNELGVIMLSGFSGQQLSYVLSQEDITKCSPLTFMLEVVDSEKYKNLVIYD